LSPISSCFAILKVKTPVKGELYQENSLTPIIASHKIKLFLSLFCFFARFSPDVYLKWSCFANENSQCFFVGSTALDLSWLKKGRKLDKRDAQLTLNLVPGHERSQYPGHSQKSQTVRLHARCSVSCNESIYKRQ
jgi:hypothetical protein